MKDEKGLIYDLLSLLPYMFLILALVSLALFLKSLSDRNDFMNYTEDILARYGGTTQEAILALDTYSDERYDGNFRVSGNSSEPYQYGEKMEYSLYGFHDLIFFDIPFSLTTQTKTVSEVRP